MASLHKDPRSKSPYWYCAYTLPNGKRVFRSTKQTDYEKAEEFRRGVDRAGRLGVKGNLTETRARELISEIVEHTLGEPIKFYTGEEWLRQWLDGKRKAKADGTYLKYRRTIESFIESIGPKAKKNLNQITPREIQWFRDAELEAGKHPNTCDSLLKHLRMPFRVAVRQGYITHNPAEAVEPLHRRDMDEEKGTFDIEQIHALLAVSDGEWQGLILIGFYTGQRLRDIVKLRWESIDLERQNITFRQQKTATRVVIPIHPELHAYLMGLPAPDDADAFVFPVLAAKRTSGKSGLSMAFVRIMERANVRGKVLRKPQGKGRTVHSLSFHSLRHSFNSILANAGVAQEIRQKLTGHASAEMNKRYTHHDDVILRRAVNVIPVLNSYDSA
jgi:integrase